MRIKLIIIIMLLATTLGCLPRIQPETGTKFDVNQFNQITANKTTKQDLQSLLGAPQAQGIKETGRESWTYFYVAIDYPSRCILIASTLDVKYQYMQLNLTFEGDVVYDKSYEMTRELPKAEKK